MPDNTPFELLLQQARDGDAEAAAELVRRYEPAIRRAVRVRLWDARLRRILETTDICQSVLGGFFVRLHLGEFELQEPKELVALLVRMAQNKLTDHARRQNAAKRDGGRPVDLSDRHADSRETPSQIVAARELLQKFRAALSPDERQLAELRAAGRSWLEIEAERGESAEALRKRLHRAIERATAELDLENI